jgi:hypothetical protein
MLVPTIPAGFPATWSRRERSEQPFRGTRRKHAERHRGDSVEISDAGHELAHREDAPAPERRTA